jgi:hypothetical protein
MATPIDAMSIPSKVPRRIVRANGIGATIRGRRFEADSEDRRHLRLELLGSPERRSSKQSVEVVERGRSQALA